MTDAPLTIEELAELATYIRAHPEYSIRYLGTEARIKKHGSPLSLIYPRAFLALIKQQRIKEGI